jgi:O-antigen/teichoic acid export membrane protein
MLVATATGLVDVVLAMAGHTTWNLLNATGALAVNLGLDLWLIPAHGVVGAAIGWAVAIVVRNVAALVQVALSTGLHPVSKGPLYAAGVTLTSFLVVPLAMRMWIGDSAMGLLASLVAGGGVFVAGCYLLREDLLLDKLRAVRG